MSDVVEFDKFDLIFSDPPYSDNDASRYGFILINRRKVFSECFKVLKKNGFLVWMDQSWPMYKKFLWDFIGVISIERSTNHRTRTVYIYQKK